MKMPAAKDSVYVAQLQYIDCPIFPEMKSFTASLTWLDSVKLTFLPFNILSV